MRDRIEHLKRLKNVRRNATQSQLHNYAMSMNDNQLNFLHEAVESGGIRASKFWPADHKVAIGDADNLRGHTSSKVALAKRIRDSDKAAGSFSSIMSGVGKMALKGAKAVGKFVQAHPAAVVGVGLTGASMVSSALKFKQKADNDEANRVASTSAIDRLLADPDERGGALQFPMPIALNNPMSFLI